MKLPRAIRLDPSDTFIFERAAEPGEWAVSGAFLFEGADPETMGAKERHAFRAGFLGVASFGFTTLVEVVSADEAQRAQAVAQLAANFLKLGAPDGAAATRAAEEEVAFAATLCEHEVGSLLAVERRVEGGDLRERFRTLRPRPAAPGADRTHAFARAFTFHEVEGEEEPEERVDLVSLADRKGAVKDGS
ncbi:MAG TPA: DUF6505 family protein [Beijerinckiaceae bacterium]|jgi:hypothetical protein